MALEQSYTSEPAGSPQPGASPVTEDKTNYWSLEKLRKCYTDYLFSKRDEINEQIDARRYYHGSHWTKEQIAVLKKRKQPVMTFNRIARKIDGVVGTIERLRQDPKAYARTPQHEQGADLATASIRYVLDEQEWKAKSPQVAHDGAVDGIGGIELEITQGDHGDPEIGFEVVDVQAYFYDPRSYMDDFSDARFQGLGKWVDEDIARQMFSDAPDSAFESDVEMTSNSDREMKWFSTASGVRRVRLIEIWYKHDKGWCYAIFTGSAILMEGRSWLKDEKGRDICKFQMFSGNVDQDGDRYGFVRNMRSAQDGLNAKQSKMQHMLASKRIFITRGSVTDIENVRKEAARADGVVLVDRPVNEGIKIDDQSFDFAGMTKMLELNIQEIENYGPNHALVGQGGVEQNSGRAIALLQQAGMAELGPYMLAYKGWKIRVYRAIWNAIQQHWKAERWIRVTDDQNLAQYIQVNGIGIDPQTGMPTIVNAVGSLDVDIIMEEGPDNITSMQETNETLQQVLPAVAPLLTPGKASSLVDILIETSALPPDAKKKYRDQAMAEAQQPPPVPPEVQAAQAKAQLELKTKADAHQMDMAQTAEKGAQDARQRDMEFVHKSRMADQEFDHKQRMAAVDAAAKVDQSRMDNENTAAQQQMEREHMAHKHAMERDQTEHKAAVAMKQEDHKASKTDTGQVKTIAETFAKSMMQIADAIKESAKEKDDGPKKIKVDRDKAGRITGATVN